MPKGTNRIFKSVRSRRVTATEDKSQRDTSVCGPTLAYTLMSGFNERPTSLSPKYHDIFRTP
jgi:hypothetical protein